MKILRIAQMFLLLAAATAMALDLGPAAPPKPESTRRPPPPDPAVLRQGGDTIADAVQIWFPFFLTGTTVGYTDDYDEVCPYTQSTSPDVVYTFALPYDTWTDIDMDGSTYDTKIYIYDEELTLIACNDDFYPDYVSKLENVPLLADVTYYLVIDGYGGDAGDYVVTSMWIDDFCDVEPAPGMNVENEPPLVDGYLDAHNGGCNSPDFGDPFGVLGGDAHFFGRSGWYLSVDGEQFRDTDWFVHQLGPDGVRSITVFAEEDTYIFQLGPQDCAEVGVLQNVLAPACEDMTLTVTGEPFGTVWIWVGPTIFDGQGEYDYTLSLDPLDVVGVQSKSWSSVQGLFR
ncbi:MAG: hypothetical protein R3D98_01075 [Candidatus Krumholzibacteriia bacterium]